MKSKYIAASHSFQEQPEKEERPSSRGTPEQISYETNLYNEYLSTLRLIPCRPGDKWQEDFIYEEHLDYTVYEYSDENRIHRIEIVPVNTDDEDIYDAVRRKRNQMDTPAPSPTTEQAELWNEVLSYTAEQHSKIAIEIADQKWNAATAIVDTIYKFLLERYTIFRRSEQKLSCSLDEQQCRDSCDNKEDRSQCPFVTRKGEAPEAVEFKDWCEKNESALCFREQRTLSTAELYAEFQLFKKRS